MTALTVSRIDQTALWVVNRPAARNAIDPDVARDLDAALGAVEADPSIRAVVLTGEGEQAFIAGADLKFLRDAGANERAALDTQMGALLARLEALPVPVIAALNGVVLGGGAEVALAADLRIAEPHASLTFKHAAMGVTPGWGGLRRLAGLTGRGTASRLLFTAQPMSADDLLRVGLYDEVVARGEARTRALALASAIAETSPAAVSDLKRLLSVAYGEGPAALAPVERPTFLARAAAPDHAEALRAFFERRPPRFAPRG